jgi:hypothetical protein
MRLHDEAHLVSRIGWQTVPVVGIAGLVAGAMALTAGLGRLVGVAV